MNSVSAPSLHFEVLPPATRRAFEHLKNLSFLKQPGWYLAGGTALALQVGHRQSVDLDFFRSRKFDTFRIEPPLLETRKWTTTLRTDGTLFGEFDSAKVSFIAYPFFVPAQKPLRQGTIAILKPADIAAMKIVAVSQRGRKRDFIDLYWYCRHMAPLQTAVRAAIAQYPGTQHNIPHFFKSLVYFEDADQDPMPQLFFNADWRTVKQYFNRTVPQVAREVMGLA